MRRRMVILCLVYLYLRVCICVFISVCICICVLDIKQTSSAWEGGGIGWPYFVFVGIMVFKKGKVRIFFVSSVRSSSGYHGLIRTYPQPLFQIFQIIQILKWKWKWKDPTGAIFLKSMGFKDIDYDIPVYQM